jgi:glycogen phosphorylase
MPKTLETPKTPDTQILGPLSEELRRHIVYTLGNHDEEVHESEFFMASAIAIRDRVSDYWRATQERIARTNEKFITFRWNFFWADR